MASLLGLGSDNVYLIHVNSKGKMDVQHLEQEIQRALEEGAAPFMVSATAGKKTNFNLNNYVHVSRIQVQDILPNKSNKYHNLLNMDELIMCSVTRRKTGI